MHVEESKKGVERDEKCAGSDEKKGKERSW